MGLGVLREHKKALIMIALVIHTCNHSIMQHLSLLLEFLNGSFGPLQARLLFCDCTVPPVDGGDVDIDLWIRGVSNERQRGYMKVFKAQRPAFSQSIRHTYLRLQVTDFRLKLLLLDGEPVALSPQPLRLFLLRAIQHPCPTHTLSLTNSCKHDATEEGLILNAPRSSAW